MEQPDLASMLRTATREVHERLHVEPRFAALQAGTIEGLDYDALMARTGGFYAVFDDHMVAACTRFRDDNDYSYRLRAPLFPKRLSVHVELPAINSLAALAGAAYVVDGAVLGGQVMGRGLTAEQIHPYWKWCSRDGAAVWRSAKLLIARADTGYQAQERAVQTADAVFHAFESAITQATSRSYA